MTAVAEPAADTSVAPGHWPKLIPQHRVYGPTGYTGVSRVGWFRAKAAGATPKPVSLPGGGIYYRRADLDKWVDRLQSAR